jgi:hypothetical protein
MRHMDRIEANDDAMSQSLEEEEEEVEEFYLPLEFVDFQGTNLLQTFKNYSLIVRDPHDFPLQDIIPLFIYLFLNRD